MEMMTINTKNQADANRQTADNITEVDSIMAHKNKFPHPPLKPMVKLLAFFAAIGGFLFGYDTGVISGALIQLRMEFNLSTAWQELVVSVTIGAAAIASLIGVFLNNRLGRRPVIIIASSVFTIGAVMQACAQSKVVLLIGRLVIGLGVGLAAMTVPMYIAEVSPPHARGKLVTLNNCFITSGQAIAGIVDGAFSYFPWGWRAMLGLAAVPAIIQFIGFYFLPESPRWLMTQGHKTKAQDVLKKTLGEHDAVTEYDHIMAAEDAQKKMRDELKGKSVLIRILTTPPVRKAIIVGCGLQFIAQFAGINTIMYYSGTIIRMSGVKSDITTIWLAAAVATTNFVGTLVGLYLVSRISRRSLTLGSLGLVTLALSFMAVCFLLMALSSPTTNIVNPNAGACATYSSCDSCILQEDCGFCYEEKHNTFVNNSGSCLPLCTKDMRYSAVGRCSKQNQTSYTVWAYDFCPNPYGSMALIGMVLYLLVYSPGMGPMPWAVNSEIYPMWARSFGNGCATATNWISNLIISMTFLSLTQEITRYGTFLLYTGVCVLGFVFLFTLLPETKDKPLEEVINLFDQPVQCCGGSVPRYQRLDSSDLNDQPSM